MATSLRRPASSTIARWCALVVLGGGAACAPNGNNPAADDAGLCSPANPETGWTGFGLLVSDARTNTPICNNVTVELTGPTYDQTQTQGVLPPNDAGGGGCLFYYQSLHLGLYTYTVTKTGYATQSGVTRVYNSSQTVCFPVTDPPGVTVQLVPIDADAGG